MWHRRLASPAARLGKIGRDLTLLAQSEVGEAFESQGERRLIVDAAQTESGSRGDRGRRRDPRAGARRDDAGGDAAGARTGRRRMAGRMADAGGVDRRSHASRPMRLPARLGNLHIDPSAMRRNLEVRGGVAMAEALSSALMAHVSRSDAMKHVERLCRIAERDGGSLRDAAARDPEMTRWLPPAEIDRVLAPENFLGRRQGIRRARPDAVGV